MICNKNGVVWLTGCEENLVDVCFKVTVRCVSATASSSASRPEAVFGVWTEGMVVKALPKYGERFANDLEWVG